MSKWLNNKNIPINLTKSFQITSVCRADIDEKKYPKKFIAGLADDDMERIASKMANAYCDCCFWIALECQLKIIMEERGFKK